MSDPVAWRWVKHPYLRTDWMLGKPDADELRYAAEREGYGPIEYARPDRFDGLDLIEIVERVAKAGPNTKRNREQRNLICAEIRRAALWFIEPGEDEKREWESRGSHARDSRASSKEDTGRAG